jgi:flavin reductase (DIM6/NTAB) family NADH-FMN oxidoreductase RutF
LDLIDQVVGVGTCSGADTDKFDKFGLTPLKGKHVGAPLIKECLANIECKVIEILEKYHIVVLDGVEAYFDESREEKRTIHAIGDGNFILDGIRLDRREMMRSKLPDGV